MSAVDYSARPAAVRPSLSVVAITWISDAVRALQNRRAFYRLGALSDIELHDIGLTRADLNVATDMALNSDRTAHLNRCARRRINRMETYAQHRA